MLVLPQIAVGTNRSSALAAMVATASAYRRVPKVVRRHVDGGASRQHFRDFVATEFCGPTDTDADDAARLLLTADYADLLSGVHCCKQGS